MAVFNKKTSRIAILYIATGRYIVFWEDFYKSAEKYLLKDCIKEYFVFTDSKVFPYSQNSNVRVIEQKNLGWPDNTLMRFDMFLSQEEELKNFDYIYFFNANMKIVAPIGDEFLPDQSGLVIALHPGFYNKNPEDFSYERNPTSTAYIPYGQGKYYHPGGLSGGTSKEYIKLCKICSSNIKKDREKGIIAVWHDESHLNKYVLDKDFKLLSCKYLYPEDWDLPEFKNDIKIILREKRKIKYGGLDWLRGDTDKKITYLSYYTKKFLNFFDRYLNKKA